MMNEIAPVIPVGREPHPLQPNEQSSGVSLPTKAKGRNHSDRFHLLNIFIDSGMVDLPRLEALVWLVLYRDARGDSAETSVGYIARRIGVDRRSVTRALKRLRAEGFVKVVKRGGLNKGTNIYRIIPHVARHASSQPYTTDIANI